MYWGELSAALKCKIQYFYIRWSEIHWKFELLHFMYWLMMTCVQRLSHNWNSMCWTLWTYWMFIVLVVCHDKCHDSLWLQQIYLSVLWLSERGILCLKLNYILDILPEPELKESCVRQVDKIFSYNSHNN